MPKFEPGHPKIPGSGRQKGTPNKPHPREAVKTAFAAMALRHMTALDDLLRFVIETPKYYDRMDVAKLMVQVMTVATRHAAPVGFAPPVIDPAPIPVAPPPDEPRSLSAREQMDALLFSNKLKGNAYIVETLRLNRLIKEEEEAAAAKKQAEETDAQASRSSDDPTTPI